MERDGAKKFIGAEKFGPSDPVSHLRFLIENKKFDSSKSARITNMIKRATLEPAISGERIKV